MKSKTPKTYQYLKHLIPVLRPEFDREGRYLDENQKSELRIVGLTPTKWTQIRRKGPKTVDDLCAMAHIINCNPGDLIILEPIHV